MTKTPWGVSEPLRPIKHRSYVKCLERCTRILTAQALHESSASDDTEMIDWEIYSLMLGIDSHLDHSRCRICRRQRAQVLEEMPLQERLFIARCIRRARIIAPDKRTADTIYRIGRSGHGQVFLILGSVLYKYFESRDTDLSRKHTIRWINTALDVVWPAVRDHLPDDAIPASRRGS